MADIKLPPLAWPYTGLATNIKEMIRARDLEVAKCVLEAAAQACFPACWAEECADEIRNLKVSHD